MQVITDQEIQPNVTGASVIFLWKDCERCPGGVTFTVNRTHKTPNRAPFLPEGIAVITPAIGRRHKHKITFKQPIPKKQYNKGEPIPLSLVIQNFLQRYQIISAPDTKNYAYAVAQKFIVPQIPGKPGQERVTSQTISVRLTTNGQGRVGRVELGFTYKATDEARTLLIQIEHPNKNDRTIQCKIRVIKGGEELGLSAKAWEIPALEEATLALNSTSPPDLLLKIIDAELRNITQSTSTIYPQELVLQLAKQALEVLDKKIATIQSTTPV